MKVTLKRIAPLQAGKVVGVVYGLFLLVLLIPFSFWSGILPHLGGGMFMTMVLVVALHLGLGFGGGILVAWLYNLVADRLGGLQFEMEPESLREPPPPVEHP